MNRSPRYPLMAGILLNLILAGCGATSRPATNPPSLSKAAQTINGIVLPPDAAPPEQQVFVVHYNKNQAITSFDSFESVYSRFNARPQIMELFSEVLVRRDKNNYLVPGAAIRWEVDQSGLIWTVHLDPKLMWSDDTPVTADDYVASLRYGADPKRNWDFNWLYNGIIKNWGEVTSGKLPLDALGLKAVDAHTLQFETVSPAPYFPALLSTISALQKKALEKYGNGKYNLDPATSVSCGPFVLKRWKDNHYFVLEANPKYTGTNKPYIQKIIAIASDPSDDLAAYRNNQIDYVAASSLSPADYELIRNDPELAKDTHLNYGDFRTFYMFFDMQNPPFNSLKVRQAFSHVVDRETMLRSSPVGIPAYSYLMPGFPAAAPNKYKDLQNFDIAKAKRLLAEAGYPDGKGFPKLEMWLRKEPPGVVVIAQAIADALKQHLGIEVTIANKERKDFAEALNAKPGKIQFGLISYGMDFLDPYNMLSVWLSGGRHNWNNAAFDEIVKNAGSSTGNPQERTRMFQQAERILVEDVGGVFVYHETTADLYRPYLVGRELEPNDVGLASLNAYNSYSPTPGSMYISKEVLKYRKGVPQEPGP